MRRRLRPSSVLLIAALVATAAYAPAFAHHGLGFAVGAAAGHVLPAALLFNTLHSVTALVREDPRGAEEALERFGGLMRYVLDAGRADEVALADELAFVRDYLALEGLRLGERLRVEEAVDAEALECAVPPLLLQPLVENAVRHGIAPRRAGGTVRLAARCTGARILLEVADDGAGADPAALPEADGLGLAAVRRQLEARFPGAGRMDVETRPGGGFVVRLAVPARSARATGGAGRPPAGEAAALAW